MYNMIPNHQEKPINPDKGDKNGSCNRRDCQRPGAMYFNRSTLKYYCHACAILLNRANPDAQQSLNLDGPLCVEEFTDNVAKLQNVLKAARHLIEQSVYSDNGYLGDAGRPLTDMLRDAIRDADAQIIYRRRG